MTSVERVVEYTQLESEAPWETEKRPPPGWPSEGAVTFDTVSFSYTADGPLVLKDISAWIKPSEKVSFFSINCIILLYLIGLKMQTFDYW